MHAAFSDLIIADNFLERLGPALNSGNAMLLYGPPGNGKTSIALRLRKIFSDVIYVPHAVLVEGQIMRVYDPSVHMLTEPRETGLAQENPVLRREQHDARWVPCNRPFVVTSGEFTLEMLELDYNPTANFYEAPMHVKALGGCFIIDDFGRQLSTPVKLLNRWIIPIEGRVDYLKLHTGKTFAVPFEEMVIFSTNIEPEDLMDPAFLRRIPYKLKVTAPTHEQFQHILEAEAKAARLPLTNRISELDHPRGSGEQAYETGCLSAEIRRRPGRRRVPVCRPPGQLRAPLHRLCDRQSPGRADRQRGRRAGGILGQGNAVMTCVARLPVTACCGLLRVAHANGD